MCLRLLFFPWILLVSVLTVGPEPAGALEASGTTVAVIPAAAAGVTGRRILKVQGPVFTGDVVETGPAGEAQIEFRDNTRLVVGTNSKLTIDSFVFDDSNRARKISMNAVKGAFRFITGSSRKQAYAIRTPTTTMGIRGTRFDFYVRPNGETSFALFEGEARLCDRSGRCMDVRGSCAVVVASPQGGIQAVRAGPQRTQRLRALFPYVVSQARLRPEFRVNTSSCNIRQAALTNDIPAVIRDVPSPASPPGRPPAEPRPEPPGAKPEPTEKRGNPGNGKQVGNAGDKFGAPGVRGNSRESGKAGKGKGRRG